MIKIKIKNKKTLVEEFWKDAKNCKSGIMCCSDEDKDILKGKSPQIYEYLFDSEKKLRLDNYNDLLCADYSRMKALIAKFGKCDDESDRLFYEKIFNYSNLSKRNIIYKYAAAIIGTTCPYCNRQYVTYYNDEKLKLELDHFFPKSIYPYLATSLWNLIPTCSICNRKKNQRDTFDSPLLYPYEEEFGYRAHFRTKNNPDGDVYGYHHGYSIDYELYIEVDSTAPNKELMEEQKEFFCIEKIYNEHKDYINLIRRKEALVNEDSIRDMILRFPQWYAKREDVLNVMFMDGIFVDNFSLRPLAKLTHDILEQDGYDLYSV